MHSSRPGLIWQAVSRGKVLGLLMIFRDIERRRLHALFGKFLDEKALDKVMSELSEWDCFLMRLPRWAAQIFRRRLTDEELARLLADFRKTALNGRDGDPG